jgi:competence protein ComEC
VAPPRDPLVLPLAAIICGIAAARYTSFQPIELVAGISALLALWIVARWKGLRVSPAAGFAILALIGCALAEYQRPPARPELTEDDNQVLIVAGCIVEPPSSIAPMPRFVVELEPHARVRVSLTPRQDEALPHLEYGNLVEVEARVRKPVNFGNAGAFDFAGFLARQALYWTASARGGEKVKVLPGRCGTRWLKAWFDARKWALQRVERLFQGDPYTIAMMSGMLLGDAAAIERSWTEDFRRTGTYHTLVISGLHITVLAGALLTVMRFCFVPQGVRLVIAAAAAWGYALLTGMQIPVARSAAGFTLFLLASFCFRRGRVLNLLAAVALVFLIADPDQVADASFQLSFLAVAAIGALAAPLMERTSAPVRTALRGIAEPGRDAALPVNIAALRVELRLLAETAALCLRVPFSGALRSLSGAINLLVYAYELVLVSAAVQLALVLPSVAYFHRLSLTSLTANAFAVPALSAAVPFGFVSILTGWRFPAAIASWLLEASRAVVQWHARLEPSWRIPDLPEPFQAAIAAALIAACGATYFAVRRHKLVVLAAIAVVAGAYIYPFSPARHPGLLELTSIDVGQGDSHLVVAPSGATLLVDGGGIPAFDPKYKPKLEIGEDVVSPYLWTRRLKQIDAIALTHAHDDHARGLIAILENFRPKELWTGSQPASGVWLELREKARTLGVRVIARHAGEEWDWGGTSVRVLAPSTGSPSGRPAHNNDSLVLKLTYGKHSFLLTGDIERKVEDELVVSGALTHVDVLKVAHHGSRTSTTPGLVDMLRPAFAIVSAGRYNSYRHPHPDVMERLDAAHTRVLRTDRSGAITFTSDGKRIFVETQQPRENVAGVRHPLAGE